MPRRGYKKPKIDNDPMYDSYIVSKLINYVMRDGKKSVAQKQVYTCLEEITKAKLDPKEVLRVAIENVAPEKEVRPRRVGGASYLVPYTTREERKLYLALSWIIEAARARSNKQYHTFDKKLYAELMDAYQSQGEAIQKRHQVEKLASQNKAFAHFGW